MSDMAYSFASYLANTFIRNSIESGIELAILLRQAHFLLILISALLISVSQKRGEMRPETKNEVEACHLVVKTDKAQANIP